MYKVYCDGFLMYSSSLENLKIFSASVSLEVNKTGSFTFTLYDDHPYYSYIQKLKSIITVWQDDFLLFRGRVLNDEMGFYNEKSIICEGDLSFLLDSIQRPAHFTGTVQDAIAWMIDRHNAQVDEQKRFFVGNVTVTGNVDITIDEHTTSFETAQKHIFEPFGGYVKTRQTGGVNYIDYLSDINMLAPQQIKFGENLLALKRIRKGEEIATVVIPLGAKIEGSEERLTIASVNGGIDYIQSDSAVSQYGRIVKQAIFDGITSASELLAKGQAYLAQSVNQLDTIELTAADLATIDSTVESFHIGTQVQVISEPHGINQRFLVSKLDINILDPASNKLTLGGVIDPFTTKTAVGVSQGKDGKDGEDAAVLRIDSSRGTVFKNSEVSTTLTVAIYHGDKRIADKASMVDDFGAGAYLQWSWLRMGDQAYGIISASDSRLHDDGFTLVLTPADIDTKATFQCQMIL